MRELFSVWRSRKMLSAMFFTAFLYAALTIPFKGLIIIPQIAEIRPAAFIPVLAGILFGPAGAWGSAIGNLIGDVFGTFSISSIFGFIANLGLGLIPYKLWYHLFRKNPNQIVPILNDVKEYHFIVFAAIVGNLFCAMTIGGGVHWFSGRDYTQLFQVVVINNASFSLLLYPMLKVCVKVAERNEVLWYQDPHFNNPISTPTQQLISLALIFCLVVGSIIVFGFYHWAEGLSVTEPLFELAHLVSQASVLICLSLSALLIYFDN